MHKGTTVLGEVRCFNHIGSASIQLKCASGLIFIYFETLVKINIEIQWHVAHHCCTFCNFCSINLS